MVAIALRGLSKRYDAASSDAVSAFDLVIDDGELLVLVGPSGCGKSTVLRMIAGLEVASAGSILLGHRELSDVPPQDRDIAMVFQGYALYPHLTVRDNMAFPLKMRRVARDERRRQVAETAELVGLTGKLDRLPGELSGGERQRVAMARAIVRRPKAFLFDEPLSNLDAKLRAELRVELAALVRRLGVTAVYVTHDQAEAMTMGDRVAVMNAGALIQVASPKTLYEKPANAFVASFVGTPPMNLLELSCAAGRGRVGGWTLSLPEALAERERLTVGFRPEHVVLDADEPGATTLRVEQVEALGPETIIHGRLAEQRVCARIAGFWEGADSVAISVVPEHLHWFDASTGERLEVAG